MYIPRWKVNDMRSLRFRKSNKKSKGCPHDIRIYVTIHLIQSEENRANSTHFCVNINCSGFIKWINRLTSLQKIFLKKTLLHFRKLSESKRWHHPKFCAIVTFDFMLKSPLDITAITWQRVVRCILYNIWKYSLNKITFCHICSFLS